MKHLSIRLKMTLYYSAILLVVVFITFFALRSISESVMRRNLRMSLYDIVEGSVDQISYSAQESTAIRTVSIAYQDGYLAVEEDFLDEVNGISTALYDASGSLLYGNNPIHGDELPSVPEGSKIYRSVIGNDPYYIYDRQISGTGMEGLWIRGIASEGSQLETLHEITNLALFFLPLLIIGSLLAGYLAAGRMLSPIVEIQKTADEIGHGEDLKRRIDLGEGNDELHQLADTFNETFARLEVSFNEEKQFISDASHELRTPLSVIRSQTEYTLEKERTPEEYQDALATIERQSNRMNSLVNDMLAYTRMEQKMDRYPFSELNLSVLTEDITEDMKLIRENGITLDTSIEQGLIIDGNEQLIVRLIQNLVLNAYRYGKANGHIDLTLHKQQGKAVLTVKDDGIGISEADLNHIFERFWRADPSRSEGGTGLGLPLVKRIAEMHEGEIKVESVLNEGSEFTVLLPLKNI